MEQIKKEIFENVDFDPEKISRKYFNCIFDKNDAKGTCITYRNISGDCLNELFHKKQKVPKKFIEYKGIKYYPGMFLRCRKYIKPIGQAKCKLYINFLYLIEKITKMEFTITDPFTKESFDLTIDYLDKFSLNYSQTCHSLQGITVQNEITIFNIGFLFVTREWFWTAISRCTSIKDIYVYISPETKEQKEVKRYAIQKKINDHKQEDIKKGRNFTEKDFINLETVKDLWRKQDGQCALCNTELEAIFKASDGGLQMSINRIDNKLAHVKHNCELVCLLCQRSYHPKPAKTIINVINYTA
jgi:hypothetical protein